MTARNLSGPLTQHGGTAAKMTANNPILRAREIGVETDTRRMKIGNGTTAWNNLDYISTGTQAVGITLAASAWSGKTQTCSIAGITTNTHGVMMLSQSVTAAQYNAFAQAQIAITSQGAGSITFTAFGDTPTVDIPLQLLVIG